MNNQIIFRDTVLATDIQTVDSIVRSTGFFYESEIEIARELVEERLAKGERSGYYFWFIQAGAETVGYACYGPIGCSLISFDLYWIAVRDDLRHKGFGRQLLKQSEESVAQQNGKRIYIETSSKPNYQLTVDFYLRNGYAKVAELVDFYAEGDNKIILVKVLA